MNGVEYRISVFEEKVKHVDQISKEYTLHKDSKGANRKCQTPWKETNKKQANKHTENLWTTRVHEGEMAQVIGTDWTDPQQDHSR